MMTDFQSKGQQEPIAIIGIGCRFPGQLDTPAALWRFLQAGQTNVAEIPAGRFPLDTLYDSEPGRSGRMQTRWGAYFTPAELEAFDYGFFGIAPREAARLDPQQRLLLETSWQAVADAGLPVEQLAGSDTAVYAGLWADDFEARLFGDIDGLDLYATTGSGRYAAAGRLSYFFGWHGPSLTVDTACSSSLVAIHLACKALQAGECELALAGGVNLILQPQITVAYSQAGMMAPDGRCKFGDAAADGYVRSEGAGMVVLKRLSQAVTDGDRIYATILGSAVNNDGQSGKHFVTPGLEGQSRLLQQSWARAGINPTQLNYVEAHGTGTRVGDRVELTALGTLLAAERSVADPCLVGSIKVNLGHLEAAAGVAGLIKAALVAYHGAVPPTLHLQQPNPSVAWAELPLKLPLENSKLSQTGERAYLGVTSFGISGTNAHVVLASQPPLAPAAPLAARRRLITLSARTSEALADVAFHLQEHIATEEMALADIAYTTSQRSSQLPFRAVLAAADLAELDMSLTALANGQPAPGLWQGRVPAEEPAGPTWLFGPAEPWPAAAFATFLASQPLAASALQRLEATTGEAEANAALLPDAPAPLRLFWQQLVWAEMWRALGPAPVAIKAHGTGGFAAAVSVGELSLTNASAQLAAGRQRPTISRNGKAPDWEEVTVAADWQAIRQIEAGSLLDMGPTGRSPEALLEGQIARLHLAGLPIAWANYQPGGRLITLPNYPWQRARCWYGDAGAAFVLPAGALSSLLGEQLPALAHRPQEHSWQRQWPAGELGQLLANPSALQALLEAAARVLWGERALEVNVAAPAGKVSSSSGAVWSQLTLDVIQPGEAGFAFYGRAAAESSWQLLARGEIVPRPEYPLPQPVRTALAAVPAARQSGWLLTRVSQQAAIALGKRPTEPVAPQMTLTQLGFTPAALASLRDRLVALGDLPAAQGLVLPERTLAQITELLLPELVVAAVEPAGPAEPAAPMDDIAARLAQLLDEIE
ncbi:MAG: hypothetical protein KDE59_01065 [Anaerolineales bacterium]|nr:hypothetical protein [Anaerolineales bacterium]